MASAAYERRNARARELGYRSYYDYRAHEHGRRPPSEPRASGETLARLRGHRGAADFERRVARGSLELVTATHTERDPATGRITRVTVTVVDSSGRESRFVLRGNKLDKAHRQRFAEGLAASGARLAGYFKSLLEAGPDESDVAAENAELEAA